VNSIGLFLIALYQCRKGREAGDSSRCGRQWNPGRLWLST